MSKLNERINLRMNILEHWMEENYHITNPDDVLSHIQSLTKFWVILSEEDQDYIESAKFATDGKLPWK